MIEWKDRFSTDKVKDIIELIANRLTVICSPYGEGHPEYNPHPNKWDDEVRYEEYLQEIESGLSLKIREVEDFAFKNKIPFLFDMQMAIARSFIVTFPYFNSSSIGC